MFVCVLLCCRVTAEVLLWPDFPSKKSQWMFQLNIFCDSFWIQTKVKVYVWDYCKLFLILPWNTTQRQLHHAPNETFSPPTPPVLSRPNVFAAHESHQSKHLQPKWPWHYFTSSSLTHCEPLKTHWITMHKVSSDYEIIRIIQLWQFNVCLSLFVCLSLKWMPVLNEMSPNSE
jgi:hypothetical protein